MPAATNEIPPAITDPVLATESEEEHKQPIYLNQPIFDQPERTGKFF